MRGCVEGIVIRILIAQGTLRPGDTAKVEPGSYLVKSETDVVFTASRHIGDKEHVRALELADGTLQDIGWPQEKRRG